MRSLTATSLWLFFLSVIDGYRILGVWPYSSRSHFNIFESLMKGLARRGHQVDVISAIPQKKPHPNYADTVTLPVPVNVVNNVTYDTMTRFLKHSLLSTIVYSGNSYCEHLGLPEMLKLLRNPPKNPPYDVVLIEVFNAPCYAIIGHLWNVPTVGISTTTLFPWLHKIIAQPENLAIVPNNLISSAGNMDFWQRLNNMLYTQYIKLFYDYNIDRQNEILKEYFGVDVPSVWELESKMAMVLVNSHFTISGIQPMTPAVIEVGGLHIHDDDTKLHPELAKWMNESKHGFVYFTFGSMVLIETFPREFLDVVYSSLGKIAPVRVLMKVSNPDKLPANLPENIFTFPWVPQIKVLRHPNIKTFITHGGMVGTQEAIAYGVPLIGIPLCVDQFAIIDSYVARNAAVKLDMNTMTEADLDEALNAILWHPRYREGAQNLSRRFLDRPMNSLDTAIYWVEYVVKYGSDSLRSPAMDMTWWQLAHLDVVVFLVFCITIATIIIIHVVKYLSGIILKQSDYKLSHSKKVD